MSDLEVLYREGAARYVLSSGVKIGGKVQAQVADTFTGVLHPSQPLNQILSRGAWEEPRPGTRVEDILAGVRPI